jgi:hypothetical protein
MKCPPSEPRGQRLSERSSHHLNVMQLRRRDAVRQEAGARARGPRTGPTRGAWHGWSRAGPRGPLRRPRPIQHVRAPMPRSSRVPGRVEAEHLIRAAIEHQHIPTSLIDRHRAGRGLPRAFAPDSCLSIFCPVSSVVAARGSGRSRGLDEHRPPHSRRSIHTQAKSPCSSIFRSDSATVGSRLRRRERGNATSTRLSEATPSPWAEGRSDADDGLAFYRAARGNGQVRRAIRPPNRRRPQPKDHT